MFEGFVHPALAFGTALAAVPLVIHLLNRQRHKPVQWAAIQFVVAAYKKTRRQVQLENLLLLLLRMAAIALLALAVARPFASGSSPLANLTESRRDVVLVVDASASTGYREGVSTVFERIVDRVEALVSDLDASRGDRVRLLAAGRHTRLLSWTSPEKALSVLSTLIAPTDETLDLPVALGEVLDLVETDAAGTGSSALEVRLFTDMQRGDFELGAATDGEQSEGSLLAEQLDALQALGVRVLVEDLGPAELTPPNLSIASVEPLQTVIGTGLPIEFAVTVRNHGSSPKPAVRVALSVDGARLPSQRIDVAAQNSAVVVFSVNFPDAGPHSVVAELEGDRLAIDDSYPVVIDVPPPVRVLAVNGASAERIEDDETGFVMAVLEPPDDSSLPGSGGIAPFDPREVTPDLLSDPEFELDFDVILLANVGNVSETAVARLEEQVAIGTSLIVTVGDRLADLETVNKRLFRADGSGLLPAELLRNVAVASRRTSYYRIASFDDEHPALSFFSDDLWKPLLTEVPIYEFIAARPLDSALVLAELDDENSSPLLIERPYDEGKVFLWTTTIDNAWTRLPESPKTVVPLIHEWIRYAGAKQLPARNVSPGDVVNIEVDHFPRSPELVNPDGSRRPLAGEALEVAGGRWRLPEVAPGATERAGLYRIELESGSPESFAVRIDPREGDLTRLTGNELGAIHSGLVWVRGDEGATGQADEAPRRGELWRWLALFCLLAMISESLWAAWLGSKRRVA